MIYYVIIILDFIKSRLGLRIKRMGKISKETYKKVLLSYIISQFKSGIAGKMRLHKIIYFIERNLPIKPYGFKWHYYGQYSDDLTETLDQLIESKHIKTKPLYSFSGDIYNLNFKLPQYLKRIIENDNLMKKLIKNIIKNYGYKTDSEIKKMAYSLSEIKGLKRGEKIYEENLPDKITIEHLDEEKCEEIELSFNTKFIKNMNQLANTIETSEFDVDKVKKIESFI